MNGLVVGFTANWQMWSEVVSGPIGPSRFRWQWCEYNSHRLRNVSLPWPLFDWLAFRLSAIDTLWIEKWKSFILFAFVVCFRSTRGQTVSPSPESIRKFILLYYSQAAGTKPVGSPFTLCPLVFVRSGSSGPIAYQWYAVPSSGLVYLDLFSACLVMPNFSILKLASLHAGMYILSLNFVLGQDETIFIFN